MIYKYKNNSSLSGKGFCKYVQDDKEGIDDLMITFWTPLNFKARESNFLFEEIINFGMQCINILMIILKDNG